MRLAFSGSGRCRPKPSRAIIEPRVSLRRKIHRQRTQVYRYGWGGKAPGFSRASIAKLWRVSSAVKAGFRRKRRGVAGVADDCTLPPPGFLWMRKVSNGCACMDEIPSTFAPKKEVMRGETAKGI